MTTDLETELSEPPCQPQKREEVVRIGTLGGSRIIGTVLNLTKNILGAGVLSLPYAAAAGTGIVPAVLLAAILGALSCYSFWLIGLVCHETGETTFKGAGTEAKSPAFGTLLDVVCVSKTFFSSLAFSMIIHSTFPDILHHAGFPVSPLVILLVVTGAVLLPLCLLKDLSSLKPFSALGTLGIIYTLLFMILRLFDGSYLEGGFYHNALVEEKQLLPTFEGGVNYFGCTPRSIILLTTLSTAYIAHYNAPRFYNELRERSPKRFSVVTGLAFGVAVLTVCGFMVVGYLTFGTACNGVILSSYSKRDILATVARGAVGGSIVCSYPLVFSGLRDGVMSLADLDSSRRVPVTIGLLVIITCVALSGVEIGFIQSLGGAIFGALLIYLLPGSMCIFAMKPKMGGNSSIHPLVSKAMLLPLGVLLGILGTLVTVFKDKL